jgi:cysteine sulfinate desulfinase/cysteine desulfurase-like protein
MCGAVIDTAVKEFARRSAGRRIPHMVVSNMEHDSVIKPMRVLEGVCHDSVIMPMRVLERGCYDS